MSSSPLCAAEDGPDGNARLRVLITNVWLAARAGTETVVRDLALGLMARRHRPVVYASTVGGTAEELRERGIPVVDDIRLIGERPDVIHGHHVVQTAEAIIRFPDVPVVNVCHAWAHWVEAPVNFPQVQYHVAVDEACRERVVHSGLAAPERIVLIPNAVDLSRIPPRPHALPPRPRRALAFTKTSSQLAVLRTVCEQRGIQLDTLGAGVGRLVARPESEIVNYDLVFATARSALEAICAGSAVIVCDGRGLAGLVTRRNFRQLRELNFGLRALARPVTPALVEEEIARYDPADAAEASALARNEASLDHALDQLIALYRSAIARAEAQAWSAEAHAAAVAAFLHDYLPRRPGDLRWPADGERQHLLGQLAHYDKVLAETNDALASVTRDRNRILAQAHEAVTGAERDRDAAGRASCERLAAMERQYHVVSHALSATRASRSWRMTRPLRRVSTALRRCL
ncbi:MAG: glycosyltransferase [Hyphomonadaceae bacterium]|jgi:glycosyltransferase involved in cell wall biosynthesis|nr:glycosyltransferase [Hyphomonadaceae bacterium]